eukprot:8735579-Alexandrium_andersonii.AAC.1
MGLLEVEPTPKPTAQRPERTSVPAYAGGRASQKGHCAREPFEHSNRFAALADCGCSEGSLSLLMPEADEGA